MKRNIYICFFDNSMLCEFLIPLNLGMSRGVVMADKQKKKKQEEEDEGCPFC